MMKKRQDQKFKTKYIYTLMNYSCIVPAVVLQKIIVLLYEKQYKCIYCTIFVQ